MSEMISTKACRNHLAILWFVGGLVLFVLFVFQSIFGKYGAKAEEAWAWFLPTILPTLSLIIGVLVVDAAAAEEKDKKDKQIGRFIYRVAFGVSTVYLVLVGIVPLVQPFTSLSPFELMKLSGLWLGPVQGLVAAALGVFFVKGERGASQG